MKKVTNTFSRIGRCIASKNFAVSFSASILIMSISACIGLNASPITVKDTETGNGNNLKIILELSESYLSPKMMNEYTLVNTSYIEDESETANFFEEEASDNLARAREEVETEVVTLPEKTTAVETTVRETTTNAPETTEAIVEALSPGVKTFSQLGISQFSSMTVPDSILFDDNGIPINYSYKVSGKASAYNMGTTTATGTSVRPGVVAVNPRIIPYGSKMYIVATDGSGYVYGYSSAEDTGGFIYWNNAPVADLYMNSYSDCCTWGKRSVDIYVF